jgi:membrane-associated phospholipid phosphatase
MNQKIYNFIKKKNNIFYYFILWTPYILIYQLTNRFHFFEPKYLEFTKTDLAIPFIPEMIFIYVSYLFYVFYFIYTCKNTYELKLIFFLSYFQVIVSAFFFIFFPVKFPVEQFYFENNYTSAFYMFWQWFDEPNNCIPSLHAANSMLVIYLSLKRQKNIFMPLWGILIIISTLTCKQHYFADILAAGILFCATIIIQHYIIENT